MVTRQIKNNDINIIGINNNNDQNNKIEMTTDILNNLDTFHNYENSSRMQDILEEFTKLYTNKISRINETEEKDEEWMKKKTSILESWVEDLGEQNSVLVSTVQELENEAKHRVTLLQEKLDKMALVTKESCVSLRDHQIRVDTLVAQKIKCEDNAQILRDKILSLEEVNSSLLKENSDLKDDLESLIEVITIVRTKGTMDLNSMKFKQIVPANLFGPDCSLSLKDFVHRHSADGCKSSKLSISSLGSGSTDNDEEPNSKHRMMEFKSLRKNYRETNVLLVERDNHIADLQSQITDLHHQLAVAQTEIDNTTSTLRNRDCFDTMEIFRRNDMISHLLSPKESSDFQDLTLQNDCDSDPIRKTSLEMQLSNNIDILASKLSELEEEGRQLKHQNDVLKTAHSHCTPIITQFQERLAQSNKTIKDLRAVLTEEVAERHGQILSLRNQLLKTKELHKDAVNELQNKSELIQQLREEITSMQTEKINLPRKDLSCHGTQTDKIEKKIESELSNSEDRFLNINVKISKLENELSEKNILVRELQTHLSSSRKELNLKDETLYNVEQKLNFTRRDCGEKDDRMNYLTSQLTSLQLEVSRLHGAIQLLRHQLESKSSLVKKLETENESLCWQLNEKSSTLEKLQKEITSFEMEIENRKKEIREQKLTIGTLQDAIVSTKQTCDILRRHPDLEMDIYSDQQEKGKRLEDKKILQQLRSKLEEARNEGRIIAENCSQMKSVRQNELEYFIDQLIRIQNHRLRNLQNKICTCNLFSHYPEDSQIELSALMEELIRILEVAQLKMARDDERQRRSVSREPSQYSNFSKNNSKSFETTKENSFHVQNFFITEQIKKEGLKLSRECLSKQNDSLAYDDCLKPTKESNLKRSADTNDEDVDNKDVSASVRKWLQLQKLSDDIPINKHHTQDEQLENASLEKQKSAGWSNAQMKNPESRKCQTKFCSCESLSYLRNAGSPDSRSAKSWTHFPDRPPEVAVPSVVENQGIKLRRNLLEKADRNSDITKSSERNPFSGRVPSFLKSYNERKLDSFDHFVTDLENVHRIGDWHA